MANLKKLCEILAGQYTADRYDSNRKYSYFLIDNTLFYVIDEKYAANTKKIEKSVYAIIKYSFSQMKNYGVKEHVIMARDEDEKKRIQTVKDSIENKVVFIGTDAGFMKLIF